MWGKLNGESIQSQRKQMTLPGNIRKPNQGFKNQKGKKLLRKLLKLLRNDMT